MELESVNTFVYQFRQLDDLYVRHLVASLLFLAFTCTTSVYTHRSTDKGVTCVLLLGTRFSQWHSVPSLWGFATGASARPEMVVALTTTKKRAECERECGMR